MQERLLLVLRQAAAQFRQRSAREQLLIAGAGFTALLVFVQVALVSPLRGRLEASRTQVEQAERDLSQITVLAPELQTVLARVGAVEQRIQPGAQTNLQALLEQLAKDAGIPSVGSIRPRNAGTRNEQFPETRAEVQLNGATLGQLVQYLYKIESAPLYLIVRSLAIRSRPDATLDVTFQVSSFQRA